MHRIAEAPLEMNLLKAWFQGPHPLGFWMLPSVKTLQPLWATCYSVWPPVWMLLHVFKCNFLYFNLCSLPPILSLDATFLSDGPYLATMALLSFFFPVFFFLLYLQLQFNFSSDSHIRSHKEELIYSSIESGIKGMKPLFLCQVSHYKFPHLTSSSISVTGNKWHKPQYSVRRPCSHH